MDIKKAVQDKANYAEIVAWYQSQGDLSGEQLVLLADTIDAMSEEIFEHYKALCDIMKGQLQRIRRACEEKGCRSAFPDSSMRSQLAYAVRKACEQGAVLAEKYEKLAIELEQ